MIDKYDEKCIIQLPKYYDNGLVSQSAAKHKHCDVWFGCVTIISILSFMSCLEMFRTPMVFMIWLFLMMMVVRFDLQFFSLNAVKERVYDSVNKEVVE